MKRKRKGRSVALPLVLIAIAALAGGAWYVLHRHADLLPSWQGAQTPTPTANAPIAAATDHVDPANEGRTLRVSGVLRVVKPARDTELGLQSGNALALLRDVEMRQWREACTGAGCTYALAWTAKPIDWRSFRVPAGHQNTTPFPFSSTRFLAAQVRLGAFEVDPALAAGTTAAVDYPVGITQLPANLAATFREDQGILYTAAAGAPPAAGDLRISYRIVPAGEQHLRGIQKGDQLIAPDSP